MWCWQGVLSAVWRMTLVAMALQGCGRCGRGEDFPGTGAGAAWWCPDPRCCEDIAWLELDWSVKVSTKLGL